jgi:hypothetical protein
MINPRRLAARYMASKSEVPPEVSNLDFPKFMAEIRKLIEAEREAREDYREANSEVAQAIYLFNKKFQDLPSDFDKPWQSVFQAGRHHMKDRRTTDLLGLLEEAQREFGVVSRRLYGI